MQNRRCPAGRACLKAGNWHQLGVPASMTLELIRMLFPMLLPYMLAADRLAPRRCGGITGVVYATNVRSPIANLLMLPSG
jgi:hypothetical protein